MRGLPGERVSDVVDIDAFLRGEGYEPAASRARARGVLEAGQLTRSGKRGMAAEKVPAARALLASAFLRVCADEDCVRLAAASSGRGLVTVHGPACEVCGGSNNRRAARALALRLRRAGVDRLLVVGGTPALHAELDQLLGAQGIAMRFVDGAAGSHSARDAAPNLSWAQVMVVWGASPLPHKVSRLYTDAPPPHLRVVKLARRGIEALCREVLRSFG